MCIVAKELTAEELEKYILKCNRCGTCQDVCPTYKITSNENDVARSRIRLARLVMEGEYKWNDDPELAEHLNDCLLCKACVSVCPSNVPTDAIMMQARNEINKVKGLPLFNRVAYRGTLSHNNRLKALGGLARLYQRSGAQSVLRKSVLRWLKDLGRMEELLPEVPPQTLRAMLPGLLRPIAEPARKVVYFPGCAINVFYSRIGAASIEVLQENRCRVTVPETVCCGAPHQTCGDFEEALRLAKANIDAALGMEAEAVLTDCATCGSVLKGYAELLSDDPEYREKARIFSSLVKDINEYLVETGFSADLGPVPGIASYHDPCHLVRSQKISDQPRKIVAGIPGLEFREMKEADLCCGGAGSYGALHPEMSRRILDRKMSNFAQTGADYLVTSCPSCAMQLEYGLRRHGSKARVVHPVELLAEAYRNRKSPQNKG